MGCALVIGVFMAALGSLIVHMQRTHPEPDPKDEWGIYVTGYVFAGVGVLLTLAGFQQLLALRTPETIVMVEGDVLTCGVPTLVRIIQPGPVRLYSIRANLVGEGVVHGSRLESGVPRRNDTTRSLGTFNFFAAKDVTVLAGERWQGEAHVVVPADALATAADGEQSVTWQIEVWGRVRHGADFMHPYTVTVVSRS
jgi:hypothetical protein